MMMHRAELLLERFRDASPEEQWRIIVSMTPLDLAALDVWFEFWAHKNQLPPNGEAWLTWLMMAGRGFGKTRAGAEWIHGLANARPGVRIALVGATIADARAIMVEGVSGLLAVARNHGRRLSWEPSLGRLRWPNGSEAMLFSGDNADGLRGPEHDFAWVLTFEVLGDEDAVPVSESLADASKGTIESAASDELQGYAVYGPSIRSAVEPLIDAFGIELFDDGERLRSPADSVHETEDRDLGCSATGEASPRVSREQAAASALPTSVRVGYYDRLRAFQAGEARASAGDQGRGEEQIELPAVLDAAAAKALAQSSLARRWGRRDKLTLHLSPRHLEIVPGMRIRTGLQPDEWIVERCTLDGFVVVAELRPACERQTNVAADAGRAAHALSADVRTMTLALFDAPDVFEEAGSQPTLILAASSPDPSWKTSLVEVDVGSGVQQLARTPARKSVLGRAINILGPAGGEWDLESTLEVELIDPLHWLASCDDEVLERGSNLAIVGREVVQFADVEPLGGGRFRLSRFLRGRLGTDLAAATHEPGEFFLLLEQPAVRTLRLPRWARGGLVSARGLASPGATASTLVPASGWGRTIPAPSGGATVDDEARAAIAEVLRALERKGVIES